MTADNEDVDFEPAAAAKTSGDAGGSGVADSVSGGLSRRTVMTGAAWAVPAVMMTSSSPAFAASSALLNLSTPNMQVPAAGAVTVTASLKNSSGTPVSGAVVSFSGPSGASFSPATATTDGSGNATTQVNLGTPWARPGSTVTVSAVSGTETKSQPVTVLGSNLVIAGRSYTSTFTQTELVFPSPVVQAGANSPNSSDPSNQGQVVLLRDGTVWTRGAGQHGKLGDGTTSTRSTWGKVPGVSGATQIVTGYDFVCVLLSDGSVKAWGYNAYGQLGNGTTVDSSSPKAVVGLPSAVARLTTSGYTVYAVLTDGTVWAWGDSSFYRILHQGYTTDDQGSSVSSPVQMEGGFSNVAQVAPSFRGGLVLSTSGALSGWGNNYDGQVGDGTKINRTALASVVGLPRPVVSASVSNGGTSVALLDDGTVWSWGWHYSGVGLGDGSTNSRSTPAAVPGLSGVVSCGSLAASNFIAKLSGGSLKGWGKNFDGELGVGTTQSVPTPASIPLPSGAPGMASVGDTGKTYNTSFLVLDV